MRTSLLLFVFAIALPVTVFSQKPNTSQLSLEQLILLYNKDANDINDFLSTRGWGYNGAVEQGRDANGRLSYGRVTWAFGYNEFQETAQAWFIPLILDDEIVKLDYQCKKVHFEAIKKRAIDIGMKKVMSNVGNSGNLVSAYRGAKYTLVFIVNPKGVYNIQLTGGEGSPYRYTTDADQLLIAH